MMGTGTDGWMDIYVTHLDFELDRLYRNNGDGTFDDFTFNSNIGNEVILYSGFGTRFLDYDNDGLLDLFVANGHILDNIHLSHRDVTYAERNLMFRNLGQGRFENVSHQMGSDFSIPRVSRGAAVGDYDNDGDLDILVSNNGQAPQLLRNEGGNTNNWVSVYLRGTSSNREGVGARVKVSSGNLIQLREATGGTSYQSACDARIHFGLGTHESIEFLEIRWPSGALDRLENVAANQIITVQENTGIIDRAFHKGNAW